MTSPSNEEDQLAGIQSALILLFDGLEPTQIMDVLDGVLPKELSLWHASDTKSVRNNAQAIKTELIAINDYVRDEQGLGVLAVRAINKHVGNVAHSLDRIEIVITSVSKARRPK